MRQLRTLIVVRQPREAAERRAAVVLERAHVPLAAERPILALLARSLYSYAEADHLAKVRGGTSRRWLVGYERLTDEDGRMAHPPIAAQAEAVGGVSFLDLVEIAAVGGLRDRGFSMAAVRRLVHNCQDLLGVSRPFAILKFKTDGRDILVERGYGLLEIGRQRGQTAWDDVLEPLVRNLDYAHEVACRWWPLGKANPIVIDPEYGHGLPVVARSGVRTEIIRERFEAGELHAQIAEDFNLGPIEVERALQFELTRAA